MRVVHLVSSAQLGGTEASVIEMIGSLREAYPDWTLRVVTPEIGPLVERLRGAGITVEVVPFPGVLSRIGEAGRMHSVVDRGRFALELLRAIPAAIAYSRRLARALAQGGGIDVVHAHGFKMQVLSARAAPSGATLVWHAHDYVRPRPVSARLMRHFAGRCAVIVANSESVAADVRHVCGPAVRVERMYNAVDLTRFSPEGPVLDLDALSGASAAPAETVRVGLLGAFGRWKGHAVFLRALAMVPREHRLRAYIIGAAQYKTVASQETEASLRRIVAELELGDAVCFTGPVSDAASAIRALDVLVHASTEPEPFGMVIAEAMACGRPVVVSLAGGAAELVEDGVDGLGHPPGDVRQLASRLTALASDAVLRARLGATARRTAVRRFDRARLAAELAPLYLSPAI